VSTPTTLASPLAIVTYDPGDLMSITIHATPSATALAVLCGVLILWILLTRRGRR
jgi:hypothetical protein